MEVVVIVYECSVNSGSSSAGYEGEAPAFCLLVFALHCFIVFWLSHWHPSPPRDSSGFYFVIFCPAFSFLAPLSLPRSHSSAIPAVCVKASTADWSETPSNIQLSAKHARLLSPLPKYVNTMRARCKKSPCEKDKTVI